MEVIPKNFIDRALLMNTSLSLSSREYSFFEGVLEIK